MSADLEDLKRRVRRIEDKQQSHEQILRHIEAVVLDIQRMTRNLR